MDQFPWQTEERERLAGAVQRLNAKYRLTFLNGEIGMDVLSDILQTCHFGQTLDPDNKAMIAEYNMGVTLLARCGVLEMENDGITLKEDAILKITRKLCRRMDLPVE
jgi:hypothetical protein